MSAPAVGTTSSGEAHIHTHHWRIGSCHASATSRKPCGHTDPRLVFLQCVGRIVFPVFCRWTALLLDRRLSCPAVSSLPLLCRTAIVVELHRSMELRTALVALCRTALVVTLAINAASATTPSTLTLDVVAANIPLQIPWLPSPLCGWTPSMGPAALGYVKSAAGITSTDTNPANYVDCSVSISGDARSLK